MTRPVKLTSQQFLEAEKARASLTCSQRYALRVWMRLRRSEFGWVEKKSPSPKVTSYCFPSRYQQSSMNTPNLQSCTLTVSSVKCLHSQVRKKLPFRNPSG